MKKLIALLLIFISINSFSQNPLLLKDVVPGNNTGTIQHIVKTSNYTFFNENDGGASTDRSLYRTDGTSAGTIKLNLSYPGYISTKADKLTALGNKVIFAGDNISQYGEIWSSDGTQPGTVALERFQPSGSVVPVGELKAMGNYVYYAATDKVLDPGTGQYVNHIYLKRTDGTVAGTSLIYDFSSFAPVPVVVYFTPVNNILYFIVYDQAGTGVDQLWRSDGTTAGTYMVYNFTTSAFVESLIMPAGNSLYLIIGSVVGGVRQNTLWKSDGTAANTAPVKLIGTGNTNVNPPYAAIGNTLYFAGVDGNGKELWKTDGTAAGTLMAADINTGGGNSVPSFLTAFNNNLFFAAENPTYGGELWKYDGSVATLVKDINPGNAASVPQGFVVSGNSLIFSALNNTSGRELWITDGTTANTVVIADINPGANSSSPNFFTPGNTVYFAASNGINGFEVFKYDNNGEGIGGPNKFYVNDNSTTGDLLTLGIGSNSNNGSKLYPFATISYAVTQTTEGDTIYVDAGTYAEQITIDKGLTIIGAGQDLTSIVNPASALVPPPGPFAESGLIQTTQGIGDVHISNITATNSPSGNGHTIMIQSGGSVKFCKLVNGGQGVFFRVESAVKTARIEYNTIQPAFIGINCQGSGLTAIIQNNNITSASQFYSAVFAGLDFGPLPQLTIANNNINNYGVSNGMALLVSSYNGNYNNNSIVGTGMFAIERYSGSGSTPNATCNWYGTSDQYAIAAKMNGNINFSPWLVNGTDNDPAIGFQPVPGSCAGKQLFFVNDNSLTGDIYTTAVGNNSNDGSASAPLATITAALTKIQAGDLIIVDAGSYTEIVNVTKNVTIIGAGKGVTILNGPEGPVTPFPNTGETGIIQTVNGLTDVIIESLTVDGTVSEEQHGIFIQGGGRVSNCELRYVNDGFYFQYISAQPRTAIGNNNYVHHINYVGSLFVGNGLTAIASNNVIDLNGANYGMGFIAGYGGDGSVASFTATNNSIINFNGFGMMIGSLQTAQVHNNSITRIAGSYFQNAHTINIDATCNWYGTTDAAIIIPNMTGDVTYSPWLNSGKDNDVAFGFQPLSNICNGRQNKFYVNDNSLTGNVFTSAVGNDANSGIPSAPLLTINAALTKAQAGDSIFVDAGTYSPGNFTIDKAITILGTNYSVSPNSIVDPLVYNSSRNTESIISNSQITLAADNINIEGFSFNTPATLQFTLSSTAVANNLCNNIKIAKNRLLSSTTAITVLSFTGKSNIPLFTHSYLFHDNRFENGTAAYLRLFNINGATFSSNTFIRTIAPATNQIAIRLQNRIENLVVENNVFQNWDAAVFSDGILTGLTYKNNKAYSCQRCVFVNNANSEPTSISITNSLFQQITPSTSDQAIRIIRTAALNALTPNTITVENNILNYDASGAFQNPSSLISVNCNNNSASGDQLSSNFQVYVRKNKITYSGNLSSAINVNPYGLQISGPMAVTSIDSNEVVFTGYNVPAPAPGALLRPTGIFVTTNLIPTGGLLNINNNIVNGFKHSVAFYNNSMYGGLANGITANINYNSFTGDSISINNGTTGQTANASCNWYGSSAEQDIVNKVTSTVQHIPWLTNGTDNDVAVGFQPVAGACNGYPHKLYVNNNSTTGDVFTSAIGSNVNPGTPALPFATLDFALSVAKAGDSIYVDAGTYVTPNIAIDKAITILGSNYFINPNNAVNALLPNASRNSEAIISGSTFTIGANNINIEGLTLDPGTKTQITLLSAGFNDFTFKRNYSKVTSGIFISLNGPTIPADQVPVYGNYLIENNRFEKTGTGSVIGITIAYLKDVSVDKNVFITPAPATQRVMVNCYAGFGGIATNFRYTNNTSQASSYDLFTLALASGVIENNTCLQSLRPLFIQSTVPGSSDIQIRNNYVESDFAINTPIYYLTSDGALPGSSTNVLIEGNTVVQNCTGKDFALLAIRTQFPGTAQNTSLIIRKNKINYTGDYSLFTSSSVVAINIIGKLQTVSMTENEIEFNGTNLTNVLPTGVSSSGILISSDGGPTSPFPSNAVMNITGNKIHGFRNSIAIYDALNAAPNTYTGYGNLPAGVIANINNNSFTGDSISINNGTTGQSVNATCNWYGSSLEQDVFNKITSATVQHIPWLTNGTDNNVAVGFQPVAGACNGNPRKLYVNDNSQTGDVFTSAIGSNANPGTQIAPFATLDFALSLAKAGDSIYVDAGIYAMTDYTITKGVTILGSNYNQSPNNPADKLQINPTRNAESIISGATATLASNDISVQGLMFDPGLKPAISLNNSVGSNNNYGNFSLLKNRFKVVQTSSQVILVGVGVTAASPAPVGVGGLVNTGFTITDNRYEKSAAGAGAIFSIHLVKNVTIDNNSFVLGVGGAIRTAIALSFGVVGVVDNVSVTNNTVDRFASFVTGNQIANGIVTGNRVINTSNAFNLTNTMAGSATIQFSNNILDGSGGIMPFTQYNRQGGSNAGASSLFKAENNSISVTAVPGTTTLLGAFNVTYFNGVLNSSAIIRGNTMTFSGNLSSVEGQFIRPIFFRGNLQNVSIDHNEITLNGTNLQPRNPANPLPVCPAISMYSDNGVTSVMPAGAVINILNNKIQGFKQSFIIFDPLVGSDAYTGFGNLQPGISVNVHENSFTGDSICINNGSVGGSIDASCNWYGYTAIQDLVGRFSTDLNNIYIPYLTNGTDNDVATGFQPVSGSCNGQPVQARLDSYTNVTCNGSNNGTINITVFNGVAPYVFTWTKDGNAAFISHQEDPAGLAPGTYHLSITDALGTNIILNANEDITTIDVTITEPPLLTANAGGTNVSCFGGSNGSANVTAGGGTIPYTYLWSNSGTNASISNVAAGIYTVTVTDGNGCTKSASYQVTQPALLIAVASGTSTSCANTATVVASGGTLPYSYAWSNGATTQSISSIPAGTYTVIVTDNKGCTASSSVTVTASEAFNPSASVADVLCFGGSTGSITITNVNGVSPFQFSLNGVNFSTPPSSLPYTISGLAAGTYTITVKDANGCTGFVTKTINQPTQIAVLQGSVQSTCVGSNTGSITIIVTGGSPSYSYLWTGPNSYTSTQANISGLAAGNYNVLVTDSKGCTASLPVTVTSFPVINVTANVLNVACRGDANGSIDLTVTAGTGSGFTYLWNNGTTAQDRSNLVAGNYSVTITDIGSGCVVTRSYAISQPASPVNLSATTTNVAGCNSLGSITATGSGGTAPYQYKLDVGAYQNSGLFTGLSGGTYTVWVRDANGCTKSVAKTINDGGIDEFENNNNKNNAAAISLGATISARIGTSGDIDYFKLSPSNTWTGNYTLSFVQPSTAVIFDLVASNGTTVIAPTSSAATYKQYNGLNGTYFVRVSGTNSLGCYQLTVTNGLITRSSGSNTQQEVAKASMKDGLFDVKVLGNPSSTSFIMNVITNSEEKISMRVFDAQGRLIEERQGLQPMETLRIGERYINGVYMAEIRQGKNSKTMRLVKM